jgi:hypothetical protein
MYKVKQNLVGVIDDSSRKGKTKKESLHDYMN